VSRRRRCARRLPPLCAVLASGGLGLVACTTVRPPDPAALAEPCPVFLMRSASHMAFALPDETGRYARFGFGDRRYMTNWTWTQYAWGSVLVVGGLFGQPTESVVERIEVHGRTLAEVASESRMETFEFAVERARAVALRRRLDAKCGPPDPACAWLHATDDGYSVWWDNCQTAVAGWCRELGCEISPWRLAPRWGPWRVERPR